MPEVIPDESEDSEEDTKNNTTAKTGDSSAAMVWAAIAVMSMGAFVITRRKYNN